MKDVVLEKLNNIKNCLSRIESKKPFTIEELKNNYDLQDTIALNLQRAIQTCVDLANHIVAEKDARTPNDMADTFSVLKELGLINDDLCQRLIKAVGLRNALVHEYTAIDWMIVHRVTELYLDVFKNYINILLPLAQ